MTTEAQVGSRARGAVDLLGRQPIPLPFNAIQVDADGNVTRTPRERISFGFEFGGATFTATGKIGTSRLDLVIAAELGPLPFTAESIPARRAILDLIAAGGPPTGRIALDEAQTIRIDAAVEIPEPVTPITVVTGIVEFLIAIKPHLERLGRILADAFPRCAASIAADRPKAPQLVSGRLKICPG
ncbi:MAG: hypothetical protein ACT4P2_04095 [Pseudomonadota bacterium]